MGDRICIRFVDKFSKSAVLYAHWRGRGLLDDVKDFLRYVKKRINPEGGMPLDRLEPELIMFNFIWWLTKDDGALTPASWYLYPEFNCDTGDNGPWEICARTGEMKRHGELWPWQLEED